LHYPDLVFRISIMRQQDYFSSFTQKQTLQILNHVHVIFKKQCILSKQSILFLAALNGNHQKTK